MVAQHDRDRTISRLEAELIGVNESLIRAQERAGEAVGAYEQARVETEALRQAVNSRHMDKLVRRRVAVGIGHGTTRQSCGAAFAYWCGCLAGSYPEGAAVAEGKEAAAAPGFSHCVEGRVCAGAALCDWPCECGVCVFCAWWPFLCPARPIPEQRCVFLCLLAG